MLSRAVGYKYGIAKNANAIAIRVYNGPVSYVLAGLGKVLEDHDPARVAVLSMSMSIIRKESKTGKLQNVDVEGNDIFDLLRHFFWTVFKVLVKCNIIPLVSAGNGSKASRLVTLYSEHG